MHDLFVGGVEHSGTRWVACLLNQHPELNVVHHFSNPGGATYRSIQEWAKKVELSDEATIVLVQRDINCIRGSRTRCGSKPVGADIAVRALRQNWEEALAMPNPKLVVSLEGLIAARDPYLHHLFQVLGVNPLNYDYKFDGILEYDWIRVHAKAKNSNAKYLGGNNG